MEGKAQLAESGKLAHSAGRHTATTSSSQASLTSQQSLLADTELHKAWSTLELSHVCDAQSAPYWIHRALGICSASRCCLHANPAVLELAGPARTEMEAGHFEAVASDEQRAVSLSVNQQIAACVEGAQQPLVVISNLTCSLGCLFHRPPDKHAQIHHQPVRLQAKEGWTMAVLSHVQQIIDPDEARRSTIAEFSPVHRFLFSAQGRLLHANPLATQKWSTSCPDLRQFTMADLIRINGHRQPVIAQEALLALIVQKKPNYEVVLSDVLPNSKMRYTAYKMRAAKDLAERDEPAVVVSTLDVTASKETELELRRLRAALQRQNADLQQQIQEATALKAETAAEHSRLQERLHKALQLHLASDAMDSQTSSPLSQMVDLLDNLLHGSLPSVQSLVALRNLLLTANDLRAPANLEQAFSNATNSSIDTSKGLASIMQNDRGAAVGHFAQRSYTDRKAGSRRSMQMDLAASQVEIMNIGEQWQKILQLQHQKLDPELPILSAADHILQDVSSNWELDVFNLDRATSGHCLSYLAFFLFKQRDLFSRLKIDEVAFAGFMQAVEKGYRRENPYHNSLHAACVLQHTNLLIFAKGGLFELHVVEAMLAAAMFLAAICHDVDHPGVNNDFLTRTLDPLAILYNDKGVLESHHCAFAFELMLHDDQLFQFREALPSRTALRAATTDLILCTEMKQHFLLLSRLQGAVNGGVLEGLNSPEPELQSTAAAALSPEHRLLIMQCAIKCADLGHLALPSRLHCNWTARIVEEFYRQGDLERSLGIPVSVLMDRGSQAHSGPSQVGFFEVVALPLMSQLSAIVPAAGNMLDGATENYSAWRSGSASMSTFEEVCSW